jgi:hypothetical protein
MGLVLDKHVPRFDIVVAIACTVKSAHVLQQSVEGRPIARINLLVRHGLFFRGKLPGE